MSTLLKIALILLLPYQGMAQRQIAFQPAPVNFVIKNAGFRVDGSISGLQGSIIMDAQNTNPVKIEGSLDANTINTGNSLRDNHLRKDEYFGVESFPKISMSSTQISKTSEGHYTGNFDLTIKGVKKSLSIPFTFSSTATGYTLQGEFTIDRLDFNVGGKSLILSDNVDVKIQLIQSANNKKFQRFQMFQGFQMFSPMNVLIVSFV